VRAALVIGGYLAASAIAAVTLGESEGIAWFLSTILIHVALAVVARRWRVLVLPFAFMAILALADALFIGADTGDDCHDWCGSMTWTGGFVIFWLPYALLATGATLGLLASARLLVGQTRRE
jgi:hypothetical protein